MTFPVELRQWATRHHVGQDALAELSAILGSAGTEESGEASESNVQSRVRLAAAAHGMRLWRNNVGAIKDERGVPVRYGLANDSKALNDRLKSHDLIGWRRLLVGPDMVGSTIAQFVSIECKREGWAPARPTNTRDFAHEQAQQRWAALVVADGGLSRFVTGPDGLA